MRTGRYQSKSEEDTRALGRQLAADLIPGAMLLLSGDLGAGKTALVRGLAEGLGLDPSVVTSPTFALVHEYRGGRLPVVHVDLYRLAHADLDDIGMDTDLASRGIVAVEWAERLTRTPEAALRIRIEDHGDDRRTVDIAEGGPWVPAP
ncbi:MAG: tRNA (adenosine(37)-N6)-threonylcarbamoyltransferase complex ATPase subunit type 1 TsaE [Acidobacteriota bacterium]